MYGRAANAYKKTSIESASPTRILDELFARLQDDCRQAREKIMARDLGGKGEAISHALAILTELQGSLRFTAAPEMCQNLGRLYEYVEDQLTVGNQRLDAKKVAEAERVIAILREAFKGAAQAQK